MRRFAMPAGTGRSALGGLRWEETYLPLQGIHDWVREQGSNAEIHQGMRAFADHEHAGWLYELEDATCGSSEGRVRDSTGQLHPRWWTYWHMDAPLTQKQKLARAARARFPGHTRRVALAASLREPNDTNYWHFHDDLLTRIRMLDGHGYPEDIPLLVSPKLHNTAFFRSALKRGRLSERNWVVHDTAVRAERLVIPVPGSLRPGAATELQSLLGSAPEHEANEAIFVTRAPSRPRHLTNEEEVVRAVGLPTIDADALSLDEQIEVFSRASLVVAVHGAALTNLVHRVGSHCRVLEIFPSDFVHPHFANLCRQHGFAWRGVAGTPLASDGGFAVDPLKVTQALAGLLGRPGEAVAERC